MARTDGVQGWLTSDARARQHRGLRLQMLVLFETEEPLERLTDAFLDPGARLPGEHRPCLRRTEASPAPNEIDRSPCDGRWSAASQEPCEGFLEERESQGQKVGHALANARQG